MLFGPMAMRAILLLATSQQRRRSGGVAAAARLPGRPIRNGRPRHNTPGRPLRGWLVSSPDAGWAAGRVVVGPEEEGHGGDNGDRDSIVAAAGEIAAGVA